MSKLLSLLLVLLLSSTAAFHAPAFVSSSCRSAHDLRLQAKKSSYDSSSNSNSHQRRRRFLVQTTASIAASVAAATQPVQQAVAAPPIAIIAEELGYFPVTNRAGETVYIPAKVRRKSSEQSVKLAQHLKNVSETHQTFLLFSHYCVILAYVLYALCLRTTSNHLY